MSKIKRTPVDFTGSVLTIVCEPSQGFNNYRILKLKIEDGVVVNRMLSQSFMSFEAIGKTELAINQAFRDLMEKYQAGTSLNLESPDLKNIVEFK